MPRTCILTDSTTYFTKTSFAGQEHVTILPHTIQLNSENLPDSKDLSIYTSASHFFQPPTAYPPSVEAFRSAYAALGMKYKEIVVILLSSHLSQANINARLASQSSNSPANIFIIDSLNTAIGLGLLVQSAADFAHRGYSGVEINRFVRGMINHIY